MGGGRSLLAPQRKGTVGGPTEYLNVAGGPRLPSETNGRRRTDLTAVKAAFLCAILRKVRLKLPELRTCRFP